MVQIYETAVLGGGCFWCLEAVYQEVDGVFSVESGYSGGQVPDPTYEQVCSKTTGHAEVVRIKFNPARLSYREILEIFFVIHDPTTLNRQGNDIGPQYRSVIFCQSPEQERTARAVVAELQRRVDELNVRAPIDGVIGTTLVAGKYMDCARLLASTIRLARPMNAESGP